MSGEIIVALISLAGVVITAIWQNRKLSADFEKRSELADANIKAQLDTHQAVTNEKIDELSRRVEKHNQVIERMYKLEEVAAVQTEQIKVANHRIEDLERSVLK